MTTDNCAAAIDCQSFDLQLFNPDGSDHWLHNLPPVWIHCLHSVWIPRDLKQLNSLCIHSNFHKTLPPDGYMELLPVVRLESTPISTKNKAPTVVTPDLHVPKPLQQDGDIMEVEAAQPAEVIDLVENEEDDGYPRNLVMDLGDEEAASEEEEANNTQELWRPYFDEKCATENPERRCAIIRPFVRGVEQGEVPENGTNPDEPLAPALDIAVPQAGQFEPLPGPIFMPDPQPGSSTMDGPLVAPSIYMFAVPQQHPLLKSAPLPGPSFVSEPQLSPAFESEPLPGPSVKVEPQPNPSFEPEPQPGPSTMNVPQPSLHQQEPEVPVEVSRLPFYHGIEQPPHPAGFNEMMDKLGQELETKEKDNVQLDHAYVGAAEPHSPLIVQEGNKEVPEDNVEPAALEAQPSQPIASVEVVIPEGNTELAAQTSQSSDTGYEAVPEQDHMDVAAPEGQPSQQSALENEDEVVILEDDEEMSAPVAQPCPPSPPAPAASGTSEGPLRTRHSSSTRPSPYGPPCGGPRRSQRQAASRYSHMYLGGSSMIQPVSEVRDWSRVLRSRIKKGMHQN